MTKLILAAGIAALAISVPAAAAPHGHGGGHAHAQQARKSSGGGHAHAANKARSSHVRMASRNRGHVAKPNRMKARAHAQMRAQMRAKSAKRANQVREARAAHSRASHGHAVRLADRNRAKVNGNAFKQRREIAQRAANTRDRRLRTMAANRQNVRDFRRGEARRNNRFASNYGYGAGGCPPGLAKKAVACVPPGQAKKLVGERLSVLRRQVALRDIPRRLRNVYRDTPDYYYRYGDGYMYRVNRRNDVVSSLLPLFGLGYSTGQQLPAAYSSYGLPAAYQPFYPNTPYNDYRYADGYVYNVNPATGLIQNVDPMLGYGYGYGQMLPAAYSAYNVPYQYRSMYPDSADNYYRYAPGAIYQSDPGSGLITGVAALLGQGMTVGQPLPAGYGAYNVPYDYRSQYYDSPNAMYRYANGNIYRVNPTTQLVTALVASILT